MAECVTNITAPSAITVQQSFTRFILLAMTASLGAAVDCAMPLEGASEVPPRRAAGKCASPRGETGLGKNLPLMGGPPALLLGPHGRGRASKDVVALAELELICGLVELAGGDEALRGEEPLERGEPHLVVLERSLLALGEGDFRDQGLPELLPRERASLGQRHRHAERPSLPGLSEHELTVPARHRGRTGHVGDEALDVFVGVLAGGRPGGAG